MTDEPCMCWAYDADTGEYGMRPCPLVLCELVDHSQRHDNDFALEQIAAEQAERVYVDGQGNTAPLDEVLTCWKVDGGPTS